VSGSGKGSVGLGADCRTHRLQAGGGSVDPEENVEVRETIDQLFSHYRQLPAGHSYDLDHLPNGGELGRIPAIRDTLRLKPQLRAIRGLASAVAWAERLVEPGAEVLWDAAIYKPSGGLSETPWHQDEAVFQLSGIRKPRWIVYFWIALDDVDADCGAIRFLPGSHRGPLLPHTWRNGDSSSSLVVVGTIDEKEAVTIPLRAGDATVHHLRTMHRSGINLSDRCRKAWILGVGKPKYPRWVRRLKNQVIGWGRRSPGQRRPREEGATEV
jgi:hypothetical protein